MAFTCNSMKRCAVKCYLPFKPLNLNKKVFRRLVLPPPLGLTVMVETADLTDVSF